MNISVQAQLRIPQVKPCPFMIKCYSIKSFCCFIPSLV